MNRSDIRELAREITELESDDVSDAVLDLYIKDGYDRLIALERRWPFFEMSGTFNTVADQREYLLSSIESGDFREITSIINSTVNNPRLNLIDYDDAENVWLTSGDSAAPPLYWSVWGEAVQLWPKPDSVYTMIVRGYRKPTDWTADDVTEVDADTRLHEALVYYCIAQMYQLQEDVELATFYRQTFDERVMLARADIMRGGSARPLVLHGGLKVRRAYGPQRGGSVWVT